jgi:hypothetical protein
MDETPPHLPPPRLEPELEPLAHPPAEYTNPNAIIPAPPSPAEQLQTEITAAVADTLHVIDARSYLEMLARTDPKTFRQWVQMALPTSSARAGPTQATIVNVHSALPRSPLDALPPGFDIHHK